jgi:ATP-dependent DNA helicase PIF1
LFVRKRLDAGKAVIKKIVKDVMDAFPRLGVKAVCIGAFTGAAAINVGGNTLHSLFHLPVTGNFEELRGPRLARFQTEFRDRKFIIIDEMSMISPRMLRQIDKRCQEAKTAPGVPFGNMMVYLLGDFRQLPPVKVPPLYA